MKTSIEEATTSLADERSEHRKRPSNSQHVESVLARIFSRQRGYAKQRAFRVVDIEDIAEGRSLACRSSSSTRYSS
jgi:hypothetical protein